MGGLQVVTGAAGLIGFDLTRQLLEEGKEVYAVDCFLKGGREDLIRLTDAYPSQLTVLETDLSQKELVLPKDRTIDTFYHLAATVGVKIVSDDPYETIRNNTMGTLNMLDVALKSGCAVFLFASSSENYAATVDRGWAQLPTSEDVALCVDDISLPRWSYAVSKMTGESALFGAARAGAFTPLVVRFHNVYGPRMRPTHVIPEMIERIRKRIDPFPIYGAEQTRSFMFVDDAAAAVRMLASKAKEGGIYNVGSAVELTIGDLARKICDLASFHPEFVNLPAPRGSVRRRVPDIGKLLSLGFSSRVGLEAGLQRCLEAV